MGSDVTEGRGTRSSRGAPLVRARRLLDATPQVSAWISMGVGAVVLVVGWWMGVRSLQTVLPGLVSMKANTAACFALLGAALLALGPREPARRRAVWIAMALAALVEVVGLVTIAEYLFEWSAGIDTLLAPDPLNIGTTRPPGRMSPGTAVAFCFAAAAVIALGSRQPSTRRLGRWLTGGVGAIGVLGVTGSQHGGAGPALIAVSGYGEARDRKRSAEVGIDAHLTKPVAIGRLKVTIADVLAKSDRGRRPQILR